MLDFVLIAALGFLGSFGHCVGMCGPLTVAFSLSQQPAQTTWKQQLAFHGWLNIGRLLSYTLVGIGIGALGSALVAGGQLAGLNSSLRQAIALITGSLLIWLGLSQIRPGLLPKLPFLHPFSQGKLHDRLQRAMVHWSLHDRWWTPALLGMAWGLIPCGFLYTAQLKAAETSHPWSGGLTMFAFGLGTLPSMLVTGVGASRLSADRRSQLFRLGGWVTLAIGLLTLIRTGEMEDYTGHAALGCLMLALVARPISRLWAAPLKYRRLLGVSAFVLAVAHSLHMVQHTFDWNLDAINFLLPEQQWALWAGAGAIGLMAPAACTSFDWIMQRWGRQWRWIHWLNIPALILAVGHTLWLGSHYLGALELSHLQQLCVGGLVSLTVLVLLARQRWVWLLFRLERFYAPVQKSSDSR